MKKNLFKKRLAIAMASVIGTVAITTSSALPSNALETDSSNLTLDENAAVNVSDDIPNEPVTTTVTGMSNDIMCRTSEITLEAGKRMSIGLYFANGNMFQGILPTFSVDDPGIAIAQNSDTPWEFYVVGISEGETVITIKESLNNSETKLKVKVTGQTPEDLGTDDMRITINSMPSKLEYAVGEELDLTGGVFSIEYDNYDGTPQKMEDQLSMTDTSSKHYIDVSSFDSSQPGTYPIIISASRPIYGSWDVYVLYVTVSSPSKTTDILNETATTTVPTANIDPPNGYTTTTVPGGALKCSEYEINIKAGERWHAGLYFGNGDPFDGAIADFDIDDPNIAVVQTSDVPHEFYVVGISEGRTGITIIDPIHRYRTRMYVNVTGETPEDMGSGMRITIDSMPSKLEYARLEDIDLTGGVLSIEFDNADNETVKMEDKLSMTDAKSDMYIDTSAFNPFLPGTYPIIISVNNPIYGCWDVCVFYATVSNPPQPVKGDINGDGTIGIEDATLVLSIYANSCAGIDMQDEGNDTAYADINGDGDVDITDATCILNYYAHNMAGLPCTWEDFIN